MVPEASQSSSRGGGGAGRRRGPAWSEPAGDGGCRTESDRVRTRRSESAGIGRGQPVKRGWALTGVAGPALPDVPAGTFVDDPGGVVDDVVVGPLVAQAAVA